MVTKAQNKATKNDGLQRSLRFDQGREEDNVGGDSKEKEQTYDVANSESKKKNSGGKKKVATKVPIAQSQAKRKKDDTEEAEDVKESELKRKKSDKAQKAVIVS
eukprot:2615731-Ditylum_brightwellii.AAC.1